MFIWKSDWQDPLFWFPPGLSVEYQGWAHGWGLHCSLFSEDHMYCCRTRTQGKVCEHIHTIKNLKHSLCFPSALPTDLLECCIAAPDNIRPNHSEPLTLPVICNAQESKIFQMSKQTSLFDSLHHCLYISGIMCQKAPSLPHLQHLGTPSSSST